MSETLGKCPKCGEDVVSGQYGPYCTGKCGFRPGKLLGKELSDKEVSALLNGKEVLLKGLTSKKSGKDYDAYVKSKGVHEYTFTKKDGTEATGYSFEIDMRFPEKNEKAGAKTPAPNPDPEPVSDGSDEGLPFG